MSHVFRIAAIAVKELVYERVFYILLGFVALSLGLSLLLGQMTYAEQSKLTLDFMLAGMEIAMTLFSVFMGISLFHRELTLGSVSLILSKPISRASFLGGKFLGQTTVQWIVIMAMALITSTVISSFGANTAHWPIFQSAILIAFEMMIVTAITYFFAVNAGGITTAGVTLCLFALGHLRGPIAKNLGSQGNESWVWYLTRGLLPDLEIFNMKALASYGYSLGWVEFGWAALYAIFCTGFYLILAMVCFNSKDILT